MADLAIEQEHKDAGAGEQAAERQPAGRVQLAQGPLQGAVRLGGLLQQMQHQLLQVVLLCGDIPIQRPQRDLVDWGFDRRRMSRESGLHPPQYLRGARKGAERLRILAAAQCLEPAPHQVEARSQGRWILTRRAGRGVQRMQQALELEARLEYAPARFGGVLSDVPAQTLQAAFDQKQAGGENKDRDDQQRRTDQRSTAASGHVTSIVVSCQIERCRWTRSSSSGCWLQG